MGWPTPAIRPFRLALGVSVDTPAFMGGEHAARGRARRPVFVRERELRGIPEAPCGSYFDA
jgi:hypothetical protein